MYQAGSTTIFCLPGIPDEMKVLFEDHISPFVIQKNPEVNFYEKKFVITGSYESKIAKITQSFTDHYPTIYIKSHPQINRITLHLTTYGYQSEMNLLENVTNELINELSPLGTIEKIDIPPKVS